jgi:beta-phosphoglucomutase
LGLDDLEKQNGENMSVVVGSTPVKAIIFDCDGTLVDSEQFHFLAWQSAFQKKGYSLDKEFYINNFSGIGDVAISEMATAILGFNYSEELLRDKNQFYADYQKDGISPVTSTVEFVKQIFQEKEKYGLKLAVASAARKEEILHNLKSLNIEHYFDVILSGRDDLFEYQDPEGTNKPKPYIYLKAAKLLGFKPEECIAIEDSRTGVTSAVSAGCIAIAIPNDYTRVHDLSHAHIKIESLAGIDVDAFLEMIGSSGMYVKAR